MQIRLIPYQLALKHTFGISREAYDVQDTLIVALSLNGHTGYGETTSNPYYNVSIASMTAEIDAVSWWDQAAAMAEINDDFSKRYAAKRTHEELRGLLRAAIDRADAAISATSADATIFPLVNFVYNW